MAEHLVLALSMLVSVLLACRLLDGRERHVTREVEVQVTVPAPAPSAPSEDVLVETLCQDIRARTSGMVGLAELLLSAPLAEEQLRQAELIADSGRTMLRLMSDVLDVSRLDASGLELDEEPTDLREVLLHKVNMLQSSARARGLTLSLVVDDAVPSRVLLDRSRLRQVMLNLIGNAVKFTERGQIDVQARVAQTPGGPQLAISVIDPGVGIARERQAEIFQPFFRQKPSTDPMDRPTSGTGLGLALSSRIVQAMGGEIALESSPGLGSCFTVRLPLVPIATHAGETRPQPGPADLALSGRRILLVEDHALGRDVLLVLLQTLGTLPTKVDCGEDALLAIDRAHRLGQPFELVLMDMRMPGIDGAETTRRLRDAGHDSLSLPIIAMLANGRSDDRAAARRGNFQGRLSKPVEIEDLARTLRDVLWGGGKSPVQHVNSAMLHEQGPDLLRRLTADPLRLRELESRYHLRKEALFASLNAVLATPGHRADEADWDGLATQLHRLAGVAANFGDEHLGNLARRLHGEFRAQSSPRMCHDLLARRWDDLQAAR